MTTSALISLGTQAMFANYAALQTTGNNIANANTAGYSRQQVQLETAGAQLSGSGFFGKGVNVATVTRSHDAFLTREAAITRSLAATDEARSAQLDRLEKVFGTGEAGLGYATGELLNAFVDVASRPQDGSARQVVLARADELAARFRTADAQISTLQDGVKQEMANAVTSVNSLAQRVASLNQQIAAAQGGGHPPNDLLDQRDRLVSEISQYLQVTTIEADDGSLGIFIGGGQRLVLGNSALPLKAALDPYDPSKVRLAVGEAGGDRILPEDLLAGGSIAGLLRFQNQDLRDARNLLGQMAAALAGRVNEQQALGLDLRQPPGSGAPLFSVGAPQVLPASTNARAADGNFVASTIGAGGARVPTVSLTVSDPTQLLASDYELRPDPAGTPGSYQLTRLSDGLVRTVADGDVVDGFVLNVANPPPGISDRYLLQPVGAAARDLQRVLADPKGLAAAAPVTAALGSANQGSATVASLRATSTALNPDLRATITFTDNNGGYSYSLVDTTGTLPTSSGSGTWTPGNPIALNGWELALNGVPASGDTLAVERTAFPAANNGNALALLGLRDEALVGRSLRPDGTVAPGETLTNAYANAMAEIGVRVQGARTASELSRVVAAEADAARSGQAEVNLDEEAARLIQFQQSYQAAAKVLQVAQSVFDTLLQVAS